MADWANLGIDLLSLIAKRVHGFEDFLAFGKVCKPWRSAAVKENFNHLSPQLPWLMLSEKEDGGDREFYSLTKRRICRVPLPEARGKRCMGTMGWVVTADEDDRMELLHPFSRARIPLPHQTTLTYYGSPMFSLYVSEAVLSANPSLTCDYVLMVIFGRPHHLAYWRPGDKIWTAIETHLYPFNDVRSAVETHFYPFSDVIYYREHFYALDIGGNIRICDLERASAELVGGVPENLVFGKPIYLVDGGGGELLVVVKDIFMDIVTYKTKTFNVYRVDLSERSWAEIKDLQGRSLFLGHNASLSVDSLRWGVKPDCIYFTDDNFGMYEDIDPFERGGGKDMGIYNLQSGTLKPHYEGLSHSFFNPPIWLTPSFQ